MIPCHGFPAIAAAGVVTFGVSWLYWLREIGSAVNNTLPEDQRVRWSLMGKVPVRMHWLWREHGKLFPQSRKRTYAALSILFVFLIPITALVTCILIPAP
jgi:hypothetical protein